jgi:hypothetical protein
VRGCYTGGAKGTEPERAPGRAPNSQQDGQGRRRTYLTTAGKLPADPGIARSSGEPTALGEIELPALDVADER